MPLTPGDSTAADFARTLGASWAGWSTDAPPAALDAAIIFAPVGRLVPDTLSRTRPGGVVVCAGIHMSDIPSFPVQAVMGGAHHQIGREPDAGGCTVSLAVASQLIIRTTVKPYPLRDANAALDDLRAGRLSGAAVLVPSL